MQLRQKLQSQSRVLPSQISWLAGPLFPITWSSGHFHSSPDVKMALKYKADNDWEIQGRYNSDAVNVEVSTYLFFLCWHLLGYECYVWVVCFSLYYFIWINLSCPPLCCVSLQEDVTRGPAGQNMSASICHNEALSCKVCALKHIYIGMCLSPWDGSMSILGIL